MCTAVNIFQHCCETDRPSLAAQSFNQTHTFPLIGWPSRGTAVFCTRDVQDRAFYCGRGKGKISRGGRGWTSAWWGEKVRTSAKVRNIITSWTQGQMISFFFPPLRWNWGFNSLSWNPQPALLRYAAQVLSISVGRGEHQSLLCIALQHWGSAAREAVKMPVKANWENPEASVSIGHCWSGVPACKSRALDCTGCKSRC